MQKQEYKLNSFGDLFIGIKQNFSDSSGYCYCAISADAQKINKYEENVISCILKESYTKFKFRKNALLYGKVKKTKIFF